MTESQLTRSVMGYLKKVKNCFALKTNDRFTSGIPDIFVIHNGKTTWIELKVPMGRVAKIQEWTIFQINKCGGTAYVCKSLKEVRDLIHD